MFKKFEEINNNMQIIPCSFQYISKEEGAQNHDQSQSINLESSSSSSNYSLSPQLSLPSIPSLSQHSSTNHQCLATLKGHSYVFSLALSRKHLYSGSSDSQIRMWRRDMPMQQECPTTNNTTSTPISTSTYSNIFEKFLSKHDKKESNSMQQKSPTNNNNAISTSTCSNVIEKLLSERDKGELDSMQQESKKNNNTTSTSTCSNISEKLPPELKKMGSDCTPPYLSDTNNNVTIEGNSSVKCIVVMGDKLFSAHQDHKVRVFKINDSTPNENLKCISTLPTINDRWIKPFWGKNYVKEGKNKKHTWVHHVDTVSSLAISKDGCLLYSASWDRTFKIWRISDFKCMESVENAHDDAINAIVVSLDGYVYTGSGDRKIKVWKIFEGEKRHALVATLEKHKSGVNALALSDDGLVLYSGACDRSILVWEREGGGGCSSRKDRLLRVTHSSTAGDNTTSSRGGHMVVVGAALRGHNKAILCLVVVGDLVVSGSADATVRIWRRGEGRSYGCLGVLEGHAKPIKSLALVVDSCYGDGFGGGSYYLVYSGSLDCDIKVWRIWVPSD